MRDKSRLLGNKVAPLSPHEIRVKALKARAFLQRMIEDNSPYINVLWIIEKMYARGMLDEFEVVERHLMPSQYALTTPSKRKMLIRDDTYDSARKGESRGRFTLAHEIGHLILHANTVPEFAFSQAPSYHHYNEDVEWQANEFAGWFLVSPEPSLLLKNPKSISNGFGVCMQTATIMFQKILALNG